MSKLAIMGNFAYLFIASCVLLSSTVFSSDVKAKTVKRSPNSTYPHSFGSATYQQQNSSRNYPSGFGSSSLSGSGRGTFETHGYPASKTKLSGTNTSWGQNSVLINKVASPFYVAPTSVANSAHGYPAPPKGSLSGGSSGYPSSHSNSNYPSKQTGSASYPPSNGLSGNKPSGTGFHTGGSTQKIYVHNKPSYGSNSYGNNNGHTVVHHHHYTYHPPTVIHYRNGNSYPVFRGETLPSYVYEYRSSRNRYGYLLSGLALYNLGRLSANPHLNYNPEWNERCTFGVKYRTGGFDEMNINCKVISSFIYEQILQSRTQSMLPNGVLTNGIVLPDTKTLFSNIDNKNQQSLFNNGPSMTMTGTQHFTTTEVTDSRYFGNPVDVYPDMECFITRSYRFDNMRQVVPCDLLQTYSTSSLRGAGARLKSSLVIIAAALLVVIY